MKTFHLLFFCVMLIFAILQWNDVDAPIWLAIYLATAVLALIVYKEICIPCCVAWATMVVLLNIYLLIGVIPGLNILLTNNTYTEIFSAMDDNKLYIEQSREVLGLFIILVYCLGILLNQFCKHINKTK